jgi:hypothetical protein
MKSETTTDPSARCHFCQQDRTGKQVRRMTLMINEREGMVVHLCRFCLGNELQALSESE